MIQRDFTLKAYQLYLSAFKKNINQFYRFDDFISLKVKPEIFCLIRHDVDRKPVNALNMAKVEAEMGIKSTYYFRAKSSSFDVNIIKEISQMGHEIGYHYESLSDTNGDIKLAIIDFEKNLNEFRNHVPIKTCSMHGRPLKSFDNRDIWRIKENHEYLKSKLNIIGEVYLDIDYTDIAYINDTGRNWTSGKSNRRDKVDSRIESDFSTGEELLNYLNGNAHKKVCFQIHPERWSDDSLEWLMQNIKDTGINTVKYVLNKISTK